MASSFLGTPDKFSPAYNPIYFYLDSTKNTETGFKYIVDIFSGGTTGPRIHRDKIFPRPGDLIGECELGSILKSNVSYFLNQDLNGFSTCQQNWFKYDVWIGEEYVHRFPFSSEYNSGGFITVSGNAETHNFAIGDEVVISHTIPNAAKDGIFTVTAVPSANAITIDCTFVAGGSGGGAFAGYAVFSNERKTVFSGQTSSTSYNVFNGAVGYMDINDYSSNDYLLYTGFTRSLLTNVPTGYNIRPENKMWINLYSTAMTNCVKHIKLTTNTGDYFWSNNAGSNAIMLTAAVGPADFETTASRLRSSGTTGAIASGSTYFNCDTTSYSITFGEFFHSTNIDMGGGLFLFTPYSFVAASETKTFRYNPTPSGRTINVELYFMDRLGSIIPCNFELMSAKRANKSSTEYKALMGDYNSTLGRWQTSSTDRGRKVINTVVTQQLTVTTNWMTVAESNYFEELLSSPLVYIKERDQLWPCIVKTTDIDLPTKANKKNINKVILIEYANNNAVQNI